MQNHYGIFLSEGDYGDIIYAYSFTDQELVDWINAPVNFDGASKILVEVPGYHEVIITVGSPLNDKLLHLMSVDDGRPHRSLVPTEEQDNEDIAYAELVELCGEDRIYEGIVY